MDIFDSIVVGAGPAGCAAAYTMAKAGLNVLVLDRGQYVGAKNMWGGAFFGPVMNDLFPGFSCGSSRREVHQPSRHFVYDRQGLPVRRFLNPPRTILTKHPAFIIMRAKYDRWMGAKVEEAGAIVVTGLEVTDFIFEGKQIKGVKVGDEDFLADTVVLADGVNSLLAKKAKLRGDFKSRPISKQGVKEVIRLPREVIEDRFGVTGNEGVVMEFVGSCTRGLPGGGFIYTNKESLSLGVVVQLSALLNNRVKASDLIDEFKEHPAVRPLWRNGETLEYSAHLIPVSGIEMMPKLYADGIPGRR